MDQVAVAVAVADGSQLRCAPLRLTCLRCTCLRFARLRFTYGRGLPLRLGHGPCFPRRVASRGWGFIASTRSSFLAAQPGSARRLIARGRGSRIGTRRYDKVITIHQLHSLSIGDIHQESLLSYLRASIRSSRVVAAQTGSAPPSECCSATCCTSLASSSEVGSRQ